MNLQFDASRLVETYAPDNFKLLFKQRTKSWYTFTLASASRTDDGLTQGPCRSTQCVSHCNGAFLPLEESVPYAQAVSRRRGDRSAPYDGPHSILIPAFRCVSGLATYISPSGGTPSIPIWNFLHDYLLLLHCIHLAPHVSNNHSSQT